MSKPTDNEIIAALQTCATKSEAAELLGISRQTLYNRLKDPDFIERLQLLAEAENEALESLRESTVGNALEYLNDVIQDRSIFGFSNSERIRACEIVLRYESLFSK